MVTAHNEKFSSKTAKVDFEPLNATGEITEFVSERGLQLKGR